MNELLTNYFEGELGQAGIAGLGRAMDEDSTLANAFAERALAEYQAMGLPRPEWRRRGWHFRGMGWRWPLGLLLAAGLACAFWPDRRSARPPLEQEAVAFSENARPEPAREHEEPEEKLVLPEIAEEAPRLKSEPRVAPLKAESGSRKGGRLGVVVKQANEGPATVSVQDKSGREIKRLYTGALKPGSWRFEWDGRLEGGQAAAAGRYDLVVRHEGVTQKQDIALNSARP